MNTLNPPTFLNQQIEKIGSDSGLLASLKRNFGLWAMSASGALLIFCFGFGDNWSWMKWLVKYILGTQTQISPAESWELGAISWSLLFGAYYYSTFPFVGKDRLNKAVAALLSLGTVLLCWMGARSLHNPSSASHFRIVSAIGFLFCLTDFILFWYHQGDRRRMFLESLWVADAPMVAGLTTLLLFQIYHREYGARGEMETFLAGAISFQLIVSNVIFILCQFGVLRRIWEHADQMSS